MKIYPNLGLKPQIGKIYKLTYADNDVSIGVFELIDVKTEIVLNRIIDNHVATYDFETWTKHVKLGKIKRLK